MDYNHHISELALAYLESEDGEELGTSRHVFDGLIASIEADLNDGAPVFLPSNSREIMETASEVSASMMSDEDPDTKATAVGIAAVASTIGRLITKH